MPLPPVNKQKQGDIKALSEVRVKQGPSDLVPRVADNAGRPPGAVDSYARQRGPEQQVTQQEPMQLSPEEEAMMQDALDQRSTADELAALAAQPGASPVIIAMSQAAQMMFRDSVLKTRERTQWIDVDWDGIPDWQDTDINPKPQAE